MMVTILNSKWEGIHRPEFRMKKEDWPSMNDYEEYFTGWNEYLDVHALSAGNYFIALRSDLESAHLV